MAELLPPSVPPDACDKAGSAASDTPPCCSRDSSQANRQQCGTHGACQQTTSVIPAKLGRVLRGARVLTFSRYPKYSFLERMAKIALSKTERVHRGFINRKLLKSWRREGDSAPPKIRLIQSLMLPSGAKPKWSECGRSPPPELTASMWTSRTG